MAVEKERLNPAERWTIRTEPLTLVSIDFGQTWTPYVRMSSALGISSLLSSPGEVGADDLLTMRAAIDEAIACTGVTRR